MKVEDKVRVVLETEERIEGEIKAIELVSLPTEGDRTISAISMSISHKSGTAITILTIPIEIHKGVVESIEVTPIDEHWCCSAEVNEIVEKGSGPVSHCKVERSPYNIVFK